MPELVLHFAVPFALTAPILGLRKAIVISLLSLIPDLDFLFNVHRSISHSLILLFAGSLAMVCFAKMLKPDFFRLISVGCLALLSHPVMDVFSGPTPLLWPLVKELVSVDVDLAFVAGESFKFKWEAFVKWTQAPTSPVPVAESVMVGPIFTSEGLAVSLLLVTIPFLMVLLRRRRIRG